MKHLFFCLNLVGRCRTEVKGYLKECEATKVYDIATATRQERAEI